MQRLIGSLALVLALGAAETARGATSIYLKFDEVKGESRSDDASNARTPALEASVSTPLPCGATLLCAKVTLAYHPAPGGGGVTLFQADVSGADRAKVASAAVVALAILGGQTTLGGGKGLPFGVEPVSGLRFDNLTTNAGAGPIPVNRSHLLLVAAAAAAGEGDEVLDTAAGLIAAYGNVLPLCVE